MIPADFFFVLYQGCYSGVIAEECPYCKHLTNIRVGDVSFTSLYDPMTAELTIVGVFLCGSEDCRKTHVIKGIYTGVQKDFDDEVWQKKPSFRCKSIGCIDPYNSDSIIPSFPDFVPKRLQEDYFEICKLEPVSPTAAVIFGRRCLERLIIEKWPSVKEAADHRDGQTPTLANMIKWLVEQRVIDDGETMRNIKRMGDEAVHVLSPESNHDFSHADALLIKDVIMDFFVEYFISPGKKKEREAQLDERVQALKK